MEVLEKYDDPSLLQTTSDGFANLHVTQDFDALHDEVQGNVQVQVGSSTRPTNLRPRPKRKSRNTKFIFLLSRYGRAPPPPTVDKKGKKEKGEGKEAQGSGKKRSRAEFAQNCQSGNDSTVTYGPDGQPLPKLEFVGVAIRGNGVPVNPKLHMMHLRAAKKKRYAPLPPKPSE